MLMRRTYRNKLPEVEKDYSVTKKKLKKKLELEVRASEAGEAGCRGMYIDICL